MLTFLMEYLWALGGLAIFGLAGGFAIVPFRGDLKFSFFASPLTGMLMVTLMTSGIYNFLNLSLLNAALISICLGIGATLLTLCYFQKTLTSPPLQLVFFSCLIIAIVVYLSNYTTLVLGHPGFLYMDGSDHLAYAHLADWLNSHLVTEKPTLDITLPYQAYPNVLFRIDPRFGSFFLLGALSGFRHLPGIFTYDFACGLVLSASFLAISALFSRSRFAFCLLMLGLLTVHWFDYGRAGYFGKLIAYPSALFTIGLFMMAKRPLSVAAFAVLAALTCANAIMHSYMTTVYFLLVIGGTYLVFRAFWSKRILSILEDGLLLIVLAGIAVATSGLLARPLPMTGYPVHPDGFTWGYLLPRAFDLENHGPVLAFFTPQQLVIALVALLLIMGLVLVIGIIKRNVVTASLIAGPLVALGVLIACHAKPGIYQLIGTFYPWFLCGTAVLIDDPRSRTKRNAGLTSFVILLLVISIVLHLPRFVGAVERYAGPNINKTLQYSKHELDTLADRITGFPTTVDAMDATTLAYPLLVEVGNRPNIHLQWSMDAWKYIVVAHLPWPSPYVNKHNRFTIALKTAPIKSHCKPVFVTAQYNLWECHK